MPADQQTDITTFTCVEDDWWTPPWLANACRKVLGGVIDLDPASCPEANEIIRATKIYTKADNGLEKPWHNCEAMSLTGHPIPWYNPANLNFSPEDTPWKSESAKDAIASCLSALSSSTETGNISGTYVLTANERPLEQGVLSVERLGRFIEDASAEIVLIAICEEEKSSIANFRQLARRRYAQDATQKNRQLLNASTATEPVLMGLDHGAKNATDRLQGRDRQKEEQIRTNAQNGETGSMGLSLLGLLKCGNNVRIIGTINVLTVENIENLNRITLFRYQVPTAQEQSRPTLYRLAGFATTPRISALQGNGAQPKPLTVSLSTFTPSGLATFSVISPSTVFLNPPSKRAKKDAPPIEKTARVSLWAAKLAREYVHGPVQCATLIVKSNLGYNWYESLYREFWVCHLEKLPKFLKGGVLPTGDGARAKKGVSVFYLGHDHRLFYDEFVQYGRVIPPQWWIKARMEL